MEVPALAIAIAIAIGFDVGDPGDITDGESING